MVLHSLADLNSQNELRSALPVQYTRTHNYVKYTIPH
jgi:hypothetical protein